MKRIDLNARYFETNEWARMDGEFMTIGITDFAQTVFGAATFVELPIVDAYFAKGQGFATIESTKAANEVTLPISGKVVAVNTKLLTHPEILNQSPYSEGWLVKIAPVDLKEWELLMTANVYRAYIGDFFYKQ